MAQHRLLITPPKIVEILVRTRPSSGTLFSQRTPEGTGVLVDFPQQYHRGLDNCEVKKSESRRFLSARAVLFPKNRRVQFRDPAALCLREPCNSKKQMTT